MSSHPPLIVLTGGPCAGKTTILHHLAATCPSLAVLPETATLLLSGGFPTAEQTGLPLDQWQRSFQEAVLRIQVIQERLAIQQACTRGAQAIICDRGILDGAAFYPGGREAYLHGFDLSLDHTFRRYAAVIHLPSLAVTHPGQYQTTNNPYRREELDDAQLTDARILDAWSGHPRRLCADGDTAIERLRRCYEAISQVVPEFAPSLEIPGLRAAI